MFLAPVAGIPPQLLILAVGLAGTVAGFIWMRRITSIDEGPSQFRYQRVRVVEAPRFDPLRSARWGRRIARLMAVGTSGFVVMMLLVVGPSAGVGLAALPPISGQQGLAGLVGLVMGLVWMWRIVLGLNEPDSNAWRYRR